MRVGIVGFPYSGKTTVFRLLSGIPRPHLKPAEENLAAVHVPEPRLELLEKLFGSRKRTEFTMDFVDLPGSAEGQSEHAGLTRHLPTLRQCDALLLVVRAFESDAVPRHRDRVDPQADLRELRAELLLADLEICAARIDRLEALLAKPTRERDQQRRELELLKRCRSALEAEQPLSSVVGPGEEEKMLRGLGLLTQKPSVVVINVSERDIGREPDFRDPHAAATIAVCAAVEADLLELAPAERSEFMAGYGIQALARDRIVRACFEALNMLTFLTAGPEEARAWPLPRGATAVEAAAKVHSDMARGFIRAETIAFDDLRAAGSMRQAKAAGKLRQEPRTYVVQDGDVILFKFNV